MKTTIVLPLALLGLLPLPCVAAAEPAVSPEALVGQYGFDWLKPKTARCRLIDKALAAKFTACRRPDNPSFTGTLGHHACRSKGGEYLIYADKKRCREELETMEANAP